MGSVLGVCPGSYEPPVKAVGDPGRHSLLSSLIAGRQGGDGVTPPRLIAEEFGRRQLQRRRQRVEWWCCQFGYGVANHGRVAVVVAFDRPIVVPRGPGRATGGAAIGSRIRAPWVPPGSPWCPSSPIPPASAFRRIATVVRAAGFPPPGRRARARRSLPPLLTLMEMPPGGAAYSRPPIPPWCPPAGVVERAGVRVLQPEVRDDARQNEVLASFMVTRTMHSSLERFPQGYALKLGRLRGRRRCREVR